MPVVPLPDGWQLEDGFLTGVPCDICGSDTRLTWSPVTNLYFVPCSMFHTTTRCKGRAVGYRGLSFAATAVGPLVTTTPAAPVAPAMSPAGTLAESQHVEGLGSFAAGVAGAGGAGCTETRVAVDTSTSVETAAIENGLRVLLRSALATANLVAEEHFDGLATFVLGNFVGEKVRLVYTKLKESVARHKKRKAGSLNEELHHLLAVESRRIAAKGLQAVEGHAITAEASAPAAPTSSTEHAR